MKRITVLIAALVVGLAFAFLLVRIAGLERENARQREQIAVMRERFAVIRESATAARAAFDRMQSEGPHTTLLFYMTSKAHYIRVAVTTEAKKDLEAEIAKMEAVSKER